MDNDLEIPVTFNGEELSFGTKLILSGFTYKFGVDVYGKIIFFEPDEEGQYRAIYENSGASENPPVNVALLKAIALVIQGVTDAQQG